jgi:hypothetical protein
VAGGGNSRGWWWAALHSPLFTWTVENAEDEGEREEKEKRKSSGWRRPVVRGSCSPLITIHCSVSALFLVASIYNTVCNSKQNAA